MIEYKSELHITIPRILLMTLCLSTIAFVISLSYEFSFTLVGVLVVISIFLILMPLFLCKDIFHPFVILSISMLLAVIDFLNKDLTNSSLMDFKLGEEYSLLIIICWYFFFYFGYLISNNLVFNSTIKIKLPMVKQNRKVAYFLWLIAIASFIYTLYVIGGISGMLNAMTHTTTAYSGLGYLRQLVGIGGISALILLTGGYKKKSILILLATVSMLILFGGRANVVLGIVLPFLMVFHYVVKKINILQLITVGLIALLFVELVGILRKVSQSHFSIDNLWSLIVNAAGATGRANTVPWLVESLLSGEIDYQLGKPLLNIIFAPIPRKFWDNKPEIIDGTVLIAHELTGSTNFGMPAGPYGEAFFNFGWIGVILFAFLTGFIISRVYTIFIKGREEQTVMNVVFYSLTIQSMLSIFSTSSQSRILWFFGIFLLIYLFDTLTSVKSRFNKLPILAKK